MMDTVTAPPRVPMNPQHKLVRDETTGRVLPKKKRMYFGVVFASTCVTVATHSHKTHLSVFRTFSLYFSCPQQSKLQLPLSRVHDGVCDCCDGADEPAAAECQDVCDELLAQERAAARERQARFLAGVQKRQADIQAYQQLQVQTRQDLEKARADLFFTQQEMDRVQGLLQKGRLDVLDDRVTRVLQRTIAIPTTWTVTPDLIAQENQRGLLEGWTSAELVWGIIHACQVAGELVDDDKRYSSDTTCLPLRLAGLDSSIWWESGTYAFSIIEEDNKEKRNRMAETLDHVLRNPKELTWPPKDKRKRDKKKKSGRRRLMELDDDDMLYDDIDDDEMDMDDYMSDFDDDDEEEEEIPRKGRDRGDSSKEANGSKREELYELIASRPFSKDRVAFLERSKEILKLIDELTKEDDEKSQNETDEAGNETKAKDQGKESTLPVDPMALPMIKNQLERTEKQIRRGFDYAISAKVLLASMEEAVGKDEEVFSHLLHPLVLGTLNHGNLSLFQFWQISTKVVPELAVDMKEEQTCRSPLSEYCPPRTVTRESVVLPPKGIFSILEEWCNAELNKSSGTCVADDPEVKIPPDIPDGFAGYFAVTPRDESDFFHSIFGDIGIEGENTEMRARLIELEDQLSKLEQDEKELETSIDDMMRLLGGKDGDAFGPDGELYAFRDTCHSIEAGKYTYEVCIFGSASQKEKNQGGRGTDLGKWKGTSIDEETGRRVWKWENGAKCWNGPQRSATVYVTCSEENKVISAEEPDTCRYVLEMESYIACDEEYRRRHDLPTNDQ